ncbi:MAG: oligoribonuclease [Deltaproteobacteria bacterium]|nr:oligoribonuclease [Deltaproteobacteria bacterium]
MQGRLVWVDLEMTGLDAEACAIVEIATIVTDEQLGIVAEGPNHIVYQPEEVLARMHPEVVAMHTKSGLLDRIRASRVSVAEAEAATLAFVREHCEAKASPLCGNSVHKDRQFLERYMPLLHAHLHYRNIDVSTVKELVRRWYGDRVPAYAKGDKHRALDDIRESIGELRHYRERVFVG